MKNCPIYCYATVGNKYITKLVILKIQDKKMLNIYDPITGIEINMKLIDNKDTYIKNMYGFFSISSTNLKELIIPESLPLPQSGAFMGYKIVVTYNAIKEYYIETGCRYTHYNGIRFPTFDEMIKTHYALATLYIPEEAERVDYNSPQTIYIRKYRTDMAKVLQIKEINTGKNYDLAFSVYNNSFTYKKDELVYAPIEHNWEDCGSGIHFFMTPQEAIYYAFNE